MQTEMWTETNGVNGPFNFLTTNEQISVDTCRARLRRAEGQLVEWGQWDFLKGLGDS